MKTISVQISVPEGMMPYLRNEESDKTFERNAMLLFPLIQNCTISHGKAAEILGVRKTDLIEFYAAMGIPYLRQSREELLGDLATLNWVMGEKQ